MDSIFDQGDPLSFLGGDDHSEPPEKPPEPPAGDGEGE